eukprot:88698-Amorphochlora_amoeboformis.AAC.1
MAKCVIADYGRLGHAEVVNMRVPTDDLYAFAKRYNAFQSLKHVTHTMTSTPLPNGTMPSAINTFYTHTTPLSLCQT